jgi:4-hydroxy-4-methyl-2-oxoglutarate aldolase
MTAAAPAPDWLAATLASDAADGDGVLPASIRPLSPDMRVVGRATTATVARDDSLSFREATERGPRPGTVLVVGGASGSRRACMGGIVAREILLKGFEAVVTDGLVRDAAGIRATGLKVWCRGVCPIASRKRGGGRVGGAVLIGDVLVHEGDWIVADEDGIVAWPEERHAELLAKAERRLASDLERERALDAELARRSVVTVD